MSDLDLDAIEARANRGALSIQEMQALVTEVRRLRAEIAARGTRFVPVDESKDVW